MLKKINIEEVIVTEKTETDDVLLSLHTMRCIEVLESDTVISKKDAIEHYITTRQIALLPQEYQQAIAKNNIAMSNAVVHLDHEGVSRCEQAMNDILYGSIEAVQCRQEAATSLLMQIDSVSPERARQFFTYVDVPLDIEPVVEYTPEQVTASARLYSVLGLYATKAVLGLQALRGRYVKQN
jgi:hypothetical protein